MLNAMAAQRHQHQQTGGAEASSGAASSASSPPPPLGVSSAPATTSSASSSSSSSSASSSSSSSSAAAADKQQEAAVGATKQQQVAIENKQETDSQHNRQAADTKTSNRDDKHKPTAAESRQAVGGAIVTTNCNTSAATVQSQPTHVSKPFQPQSGHAPSFGHHNNHHVHQTSGARSNNQRYNRGGGGDHHNSHHNHYHYHQNGHHSSQLEHKSHNYARNNYAQQASYGAAQNSSSSTGSSSVGSASASDVASGSSSSNSSASNSQRVGGPPHYVELHVNAGECVSLQLLNGQEQVVAGPATVTMISQQPNPPVPIPVQVPPGHMIHQIADENGTLKHIILSIVDSENVLQFDSTIINTPHGSFRVDSSGELVSTATTGGLRDSDQTYQQALATGATSLAANAGRASYQANFDGSPVASIYSGAGGPLSGAAHKETGQRGQSARKPPFEARPSRTSGGRSNELAANRHGFQDAKAKPFQQSQKGSAASQSNGIENATVKQDEQRVGLGGSIGEPGAVGAAQVPPFQPAPLGGPVEAALVGSAALVSPPPAPLQSAGPLVGPTDGQLYGYPPPAPLCCCCCCCDSQEAGAASVQPPQEVLVMPPPAHLVGDLSRLVATPSGRANSCGPASGAGPQVPYSHHSHQVLAPMAAAVNSMGAPQHLHHHLHQNGQMPPEVGARGHSKRNGSAYKQHRLARSAGEHNGAGEQHSLGRQSAYHAHYGNQAAAQSGAAAYHNHNHNHHHSQSNHLESGGGSSAAYQQQHKGAGGAYPPHVQLGYGQQTMASIVSLSSGSKLGAHNGTGGRYGRPQGAHLVGAGSASYAAERQQAATARQQVQQHSNNESNKRQQQQIISDKTTRFNNATGSRAEGSLVAPGEPANSANSLQQPRNSADSPSRPLGSPMRQSRGGGGSKGSPASQTRRPQQASGKAAAGKESPDAFAGKQTKNLVAQELAVGVNKLAPTQIASCLQETTQKQEAHKSVARQPQPQSTTSAGGKSRREEESPAKQVAACGAERVAAPPQPNKLEPSLESDATESQQSPSRTSRGKQKRSPASKSAPEAARKEQPSSNRSLEVGAESLAEMQDEIVDREPVAELPVSSRDEHSGERGAPAAKKVDCTQTQSAQHNKSAGGDSSESAGRKKQAAKSAARSSSPKLAPPKAAAETNLTAERPNEDEVAEQVEQAKQMAEPARAIDSVASAIPRKDQLAAAKLSVPIRTSLSENNIRSLESRSSSPLVSQAKHQKGNQTRTVLAAADAIGESVCEQASATAKVGAEQAAAAASKKKLAAANPNEPKRRHSNSNKPDQHLSQGKLNSLAQVKLLNLSCVSVSSSSVSLRWAYIPALAEKFGIHCGGGAGGHHHHNKHAAHLYDHFVVESSGSRNAETNTLIGPKIVYQGCAMACRINHLQSEQVYHFRIRRTALVSAASSCEQLCVSEILSVTLPSVREQQTSGKGKSAGRAPLPADEASLGDSSSAATAGLSLTRNSNSSSQINTHHNNSNNNHHHHKAAPVKLSSLFRQTRNKLVSASGKLVQSSLSSCSDAKFAGLLLVVFTVFAMLLAIFIHLYIVAPVAE